MPPGMKYSTHFVSGSRTSPLPFSELYENVQVSEIGVKGWFGGCVLPGRKFFSGLDRCGYWGFQVKRVSGYWELAIRNGDRLKGA